MGFRAWGPKNNAVFALSVAATHIDATQPVGFAHGGDQLKIYNSGTTDVLVAVYSNSAGAPTLAFPVSGAPPVGVNGGSGRTDIVVTMVPTGAEKQISMPATADSFAAIGSAAGPSIIYLQRGDGST